MDLIRESSGSNEPHSTIDSLNAVEASFESLSLVATGCAHSGIGGGDDGGSVIEGGVFANEEGVATNESINDSFVDTQFDDDDLPNLITPPLKKKKNKRRRFQNIEKVSIIRKVERLCASGKSFQAACDTLNIDKSMVHRWQKQMDKFREQHNKKAKSLSQGPKSSLARIETSLLRYIFEQREQAMAVTRTMMLCQACRLDREFKAKSYGAQKSIIRRLVERNRLVYRMGTHTSQRHPSETEEEGLDFLEHIRPKVANRDQRFVLNMDQTPIPFSYDEKRSLAMTGVKTVHIRKSTNDTKRATCAITITASGHELTPLLVFKGTPNGRIAKKEFKSFPKKILYACQENAWMDEKVMLFWVEKILKPYVLLAPFGVVPILFLDSYRCHMMQSVVGAIEKLGVEVEHIPGGCTYLCQPVDVGYNKPLKGNIRRQWIQWMIEEGVVHGTTRPPTRELIAGWVEAATDGISAQIIRNSWRHGVYSWFLQQAAPQPVTDPFLLDESVIEDSTDSEFENENESGSVGCSDDSSSDDSGPLIYNHCATKTVPEFSDSDSSSDGVDDTFLQSETTRRQKHYDVIIENDIIDDKSVDSCATI
jgi:transposase